MSVDHEFIGYVYDLINTKREVIKIEIYSDIDIERELDKAKIPFDKYRYGIVVEARFKNRYALHKALIDSLFRKRINRVIERIYNEYSVSIEKPEFGKKIWHSEALNSLKKEAIDVLQSRIDREEDINFNYFTDVYLDYILSRVYDTTYDVMEEYIL